MAGCAVRGTHACQAAGIERCRGSSFGAWHRNECGGVHVCECPAAAASAASERNRQIGGGLAAQSEEQRAAELLAVQLSRLCLLPRPRSVARRPDGIRWRRHQRDLEPRRNGRNPLRPAGVGQPVSTARSQCRAGTHPLLRRRQRRKSTSGGGAQLHVLEDEARRRCQGCRANHDARWRGVHRRGGSSAGIHRPAHRNCADFWAPLTVQDRFTHDKGR